MDTDRDARIDNQIFEQFEESRLRKKVAMIVVKATRSLADPDSDEDAVHDRIRALVASGELVAFGDIEQPFHSEIVPKVHAAYDAERHQAWVDAGRPDFTPKWAKDDKSQ